MSVGKICFLMHFLHALSHLVRKINAIFAVPGEIYYIVRENSQGSWIRARLQSVILAGSTYNGQTYETTHYRLIELKQQRERILTGKNMAYMTFSKVRLPVGTRVLSVFKELSNAGDVKRPRHDPFYPGIVAEQPVEGNKYR